MTEPIQHILLAVESRLREIGRLAATPEDRRFEIVVEANGALTELRDASHQLRKVKRALFDPEVSP